MANDPIQTMAAVLWLTRKIFTVYITCTRAVMMTASIRNAGMSQQVPFCQHLPRWVVLIMNHTACIFRLCVFFNAFWENKIWKVFFLTCYVTTNFNIVSQRCSTTYKVCYKRRMLDKGDQCKNTWPRVDKQFIICIF